MLWHCHGDAPVGLSGMKVNKLFLLPTPPLISALSEDEMFVLVCSPALLVVWAQGGETGAMMDRCVADRALG